MVHPDTLGAAVLGLVAMASPDCKKGLCCCVWKEVQGVHWPVVLVEEVEGLKSCVSCQCHWHCLAARDLARKASARVEALVGKPGYYQYHRGAGCRFQTQEDVVQLTWTQESARPASLRCSLKPKKGSCNYFLLAKLDEFSIAFPIQATAHPVPQREPQVHCRAPPLQSASVTSVLRTDDGTDGP